MKYSKLYFKFKWEMFKYTVTTKRGFKSWVKQFFWPVVHWENFKLYLECKYVEHLLKKSGVVSQHFSHDEFAIRDLIAKVGLEEANRKVIRDRLTWNWAILRHKGTPNKKWVFDDRVPSDDPFVEVDSIEEDWPDADDLNDSVGLKKKEAVPIEIGYGAKQ